MFDSFEHEFSNPESSIQNVDALFDGLSGGDAAAAGGSSAAGGVAALSSAEEGAEAAVDAAAAAPDATHSQSRGASA
jgi:hypothetical protein